MEERAPPPPPPPLPPPSSRPLPLPPGRVSPPDTNTYVVQVPRDQIYRVPPPENAYLAEMYRKPSPSKSPGRSRLSCLAWLFGVICFILVVVVVVVIVFYVVARPAVPSFSIKRLDIVKSNGNKRIYDLTFESTNPSARVDYSHENSGSVVLFHKGSRIARGKPPKFFEKSGSKSTFKVAMASEKGLNYKPAGGAVIPLVVTMDLPVKLRLAVGGWGKIIAVRCDLKVRVSSKESRVLDQHCSSKLKS